MKLRMIGIAIAVLACAASAAAQQVELGLTAGGLKTGGGNLSATSTNPSVHTDNGFALEADLSTRFFTVGLASLYLDFPLAVRPKTNLLTSNAVTVRSYSSIYFTPGLRLKLLPLARISPYLVGGVGLARLSPSDTLSNGQPAASDAKVNLAYSVGGGLDVKWKPHISLRGEVRDYNTVTPDFNILPFKERQNNVLISGGIVLRF